MKFSICQVSVSPLRAESSDRSEMVTQVLFGEKAEILETKKSWIKVKGDFDGYEGWADSKHFFEVPEEEYSSIRIDKFASESFNLAVENNTPLTLPIGSILPNLNNGKIKFGNKEIDYLGEFQTGNSSKSQLPELAMMYLNTPYLWGGKSVFGIDCSGMVQQVYKFCGVKLPRDAYQQAEIGEVLSFVEEAEPGDLAFFENPEGKIIHVGIILEGNKIIHAHGKVRIDPIDITGIFNTDSQSYSHKLRVIRRIL
ncbi:MAG TPA: C40 family peptidase [Moheibacter sp.]|nr:C40 family peptidase [Moheibacter sp.]